MERTRYVSKSEKLLAHLASGKLLLADGATGTMLQGWGLPLGTPPERWNLEKPEKIIALHRAYIEAGSQVVLTNTFGGTRIKLGRAGHADITAEANRAAARLAQEAAGPDAFVAGDLGPSGELLAPYGDLTYEEAVAAFAEQAAALAEGGADCFWVETMMSLDEAKAAIQGAQQASSLPVFCTLSFGPGGRTMMGVTPEKAIQELWPLGLAAMGGNCGQGPEEMVATIRRFAAAQPDAVLIAKPNAGMPRLVNDQQVYDMSPAEMARHIQSCVDAGARVIGACCGSTPAHIRAIAQSVKRQTP